MIMRVISGGDPGAEEDIRALSGMSGGSYILTDELRVLNLPLSLFCADFASPATYYSTIPPVSDRTTQPRRYDIGALRDTKKRLDVGVGQPGDYDEVAMELMDDCVELSSDREPLFFFWLNRRVVDLSVLLSFPQTSATRSSRSCTRTAARTSG